MNAAPEVAVEPAAAATSVYSLVLVACCAYVPAPAAHRPRSSCVCCCYKGALPMYRPNGCSCSAYLGPSFGVFMAMAASVLVCSCVTSYYFNGRGKLSPYRPPPEPLIFLYPAASSGGGAG